MNKKEKAVLNNFIDTYTQWIEYLKDDNSISNQERITKKVMLEGVKFEWYCFQVKHFNCLNTLKDDETFITWDSREKEKWVRPMPIVVRPDYTIIDGFHRWKVVKEYLKKELKGKVPVVIVEHNQEAEDMYGTITHNRARGTHQLEPMKRIIKKLINKGKTISEICKQLGMNKEEVFRLSDISRDKFLDLMINKDKYSKAKYILKIQ